MSNKLTHYNILAIRERKKIVAKSKTTVVFIYENDF